MLRIPWDGDNPAPLMVPIQRIDFSETEEADPRGIKRKRASRKKKPKEAKIPVWDESAGTWRKNRSNRKRNWGTIAAWSLLIIVSFAATYYAVTWKESEKVVEVSPEETNKPDDASESEQVPLFLAEDELEEPIELPKIMQHSEAEFLAMAQPLAEAFLAATSVEQMLPLVRDGEAIKSKMLEYYPGGNIEPTGMSKFNAEGQVSYKDSFAAIFIFTPEFERKQLAFLELDEGLKIDWESWVGWSEMPWDKLVDSAPTEPVLIRAMLKQVDYYNFDFEDETKWRSYHLISPDGNHTLYAYTERNEHLDERLRPSEKGSSVAVTLKIRFPENKKANNQVLIEEYVSDGWVILDEVE